MLHVTGGLVWGHVYFHARYPCAWLAGVPRSFGMRWILFCSPVFKRMAWRRAKA